MSKGLRSWVQANWVDIANPKKGGGFPKCGRSGGEKRRNYPKCVPAAKARSMSASQRAAAVSRKQKAERKTRTNKQPNTPNTCLLYTSPSPRDRTRSRMPSSA